jgi:hypothetical protein
MGIGMDAADPGRRRLGALLVEAGLVSEHDLVEALAEQERSGRRLGEVLVGRGFVSGAAVANALAEQHGSFLKTEHGFGTGLRALMGRDSAPESSATPPEAPPLSPPPTQPSAFVLGNTPPAATPEEPRPSAVHETPSDLLGVEEGQPSPELGHLLFVPTSQGYLLLQRSGTAPALGEVLELPETPGARLVVAKLAVSPLPRDGRVCVYLNAL